MIFLVAQAIKTRLEADTGSGGLYNAGSAFKPSGTYFSRGSIGTQAYPYLVIEATADNINAMNSQDARIDWTITAYDNAASGEALLWPILRRLTGDAILQATLRPSYGLDRHLLVLDTNATRNPLALVGSDVVINSMSFGESGDTPACITLQVTGETVVSKQGS